MPEKDQKRKQDERKPEGKEILVVGGTGTVGSQVVRDLAARGESVRVMSRSPEKLKDLPAGARGVRGDLQEPAGLDEAFRGADAVFLLTALAEDETQQGLAGVEAARRAGAKRLVYMSVAMPPGSEHIPHFATKVPIEQAVRDAGREWTILRPNSFFQNDSWFASVIADHGVYPQPIGSKGMNRVDVRDIADAGVAALLEPQLSGREVPLHGGEALTGESTAATYARHLGRAVRYAGDDLDAWERNARATMPSWLVEDLRVMYEYFQQHGFRPGEDDFASQREAVGHEPRTFDAFVAEVAPGWRAGATRG